MVKKSKTSDAQDTQNDVVDTSETAGIVVPIVDAPLEIPSAMVIALRAVREYLNQYGSKFDAATQEANREEWRKTYVQATNLQRDLTKLVGVMRPEFGSKNRRAEMDMSNAF